MEQPELHVEWVWPCECWSVKQRADHSFRRSPCRVLLPSFYWNSRSGFCLWEFRDNCDPKEIKKGNIFPGYSSGRSHHPGLVGAESVYQLSELENIGIALSQTLLAIYKFQPRQISDSLQNCCQALKPKELHCMDFWKKSITDFLYLSSNQRLEIFCVKHMKTRSCFVSVCRSTFFLNQGRIWWQDITSHNTQQFCLRLPLWGTMNVKDQ